MLGKLLSGGNYSAVSSLDYDYQAHIDALIGASVTPFTTDSFTVKNGETVTIATHDKGFLYGVSRSEKGTPVLFAEPEYRMMNGVTVQSGGTLNVAVQRVATPHIVNNGGTVVLGCNNLNEYTQTGGNLTLGVNVNTIKEVYLSGGTVKSASSAALNCEIFSMSGSVVVSDLDVITDKCNISNAWDLGNSSLTVNDESNISGSISGGTVNIKGDSTGGSGTIENLYISGSGSQTLSGTLNATNLVYNNTGTAKQSGTIYVSGTVKNTSSKVTNGQNTVLQSTGNIIGDHYNSGLTLDGVTISEKKTIDGGLKTINNVTLNDITISNGLIQSGGTLTLDGDVIVSGDSYFAGTVTQSENSYYASGDISVNGTNSFNNIITNGKLLQTLTGTINVKNFTNTNTKGNSIANKLNVSGTLTNNGGRISGIGTTLLSGGRFGNSDLYNGDITIQSTCDIPSRLSGNVVISAINSISQDTDVGGYLTISGGNISINDSALTIASALTNSKEISGENASIVVNGIMQNTGTINNCNLLLKKEFANSGTVNGCNLTSKSDIYNNGSMSVESLTLNSATNLIVNGNSIPTKDLIINGKGKVTLNTNINVSGKYTNESTVVNGNSIVISSSTTFNTDRTYKKLDLKSELIIDGCTVVVDTLNITSGITITNGGKLVVNKMLTASGNSSVIEIDEASQFTIKKIASLSSYSDVIVNGEFTLGSDAVINSTKISGTGTINIKGDLYGNSLTVNKPQNVNIIGKTPQIISCSGASFNNLNILNPSRGGVKFNGSVYYYGEYNPNSSNVSGTVTKK